MTGFQDKIRGVLVKNFRGHVNNQTTSSSFTSVPDTMVIGKPEGYFINANNIWAQFLCIIGGPGTTQEVRLVNINDTTKGIVGSLLTNPTDDIKLLRSGSFYLPHSSIYKMSMRRITGTGPNNAILYSGQLILYFV